jgi:hypothetical protein
MSQSPENSSPQRMKIKPSEPEHEGSLVTHPYFAYIIATMVLALFLVFMGWLAIENGWLPTR